MLILEKLKLKFPNLLIEDAASILKFMINNVISKEEKDKIIEFGIASLNGDDVEINQEGVSLQNELNMNIGVLNRMKNVIANDDELMNLFGQIKG